MVNRIREIERKMELLKSMCVCSKEQEERDRIIEDIQTDLHIVAEKMIMKKVVEAVMAWAREEGNVSEEDLKNASANRMF